MRYPKGLYGAALGGAAVLLAAPVLVDAHHSTQVSYHMDRTIELEGKVTAIRFRNPHSQLFFDVKDKDGKVVNWVAELASPGNWRRNGWDESTFAVGSTIKVSIHPSRSGEPLGHPETITLPNGKVVDQGGRVVDPADSNRPRAGN